LVTSNDSTSASILMPKRRRDLPPDVKAAVNDIIHGTTVDTHTQWLQREYIRLMRRECTARAQLRESKLCNHATTTTAPIVEDGSAVEKAGDAHRDAQQNKEQVL